MSHEEIKIGGWFFGLNTVLYPKWETEYNKIMTSRKCFYNFNFFSTI